MNAVATPNTSRFPLWSDIKPVDISELTSHLHGFTKRFGLVTLEDLVAPSPESACGLYCFYEKGRLMYVGKASSRCIIERVPAHLDSRPAGWFGTLLAKLAVIEGGTRSDCLGRAMAMELVVIFVDEPIHIGGAESFLRQALRPELNPVKKQPPASITCLADLF